MTTQNMLYIVNYWMPFPSSEYGGVQLVVAESDAECVRRLVDEVDEYAKESYPNYKERIQDYVERAQKFPIGARCGVIY
jgi:hypothetical protein